MNMKLVLYKIVMPFTVKDYEKGYAYTLSYIASKVPIISFLFRFSNHFISFHAI